MNTYKQAFLHRFMHFDPHYRGRRLAQVDTRTNLRSPWDNVRVRFMDEAEFFEIEAIDVDFVKRSI